MVKKIWRQHLKFARRREVSLLLRTCMHFKTCICRYSLKKGVRLGLAWLQAFNFGWGSLHWGFPLHVSFIASTFANNVWLSSTMGLSLQSGSADTRGYFRLWGFPPCMRCIVLPLAGLIRVLDFWVRMTDSYPSICQWGVTQSGDRPKKIYTNIRIRT